MADFPFSLHPGRVDKTGWGVGPWQHEDDAEAWQDSRTDLSCALIRHPELGHWCGYVAVPRGHPTHGMSAETHVRVSSELREREREIGRDVGAIDVFISWLESVDPDGSPTSVRLGTVLPAHGGITYAQADADGAWWFGFDAAHGGDLVPELRGLLLVGHAVYRDRDYMYGIATRLAWALDELRQIAQTPGAWCVMPEVTEADEC